MYPVCHGYEALTPAFVNQRRHELRAGSPRDLRGLHQRECPCRPDVDPRQACPAATVDRYHRNDGRVLQRTADAVQGGVQLSGVRTSPGDQIEVRKRPRLALRQCDCVGRGQGHDDDRRVASAGISDDLLRLFDEWLGDEIAWNRVGDFAGRSRVKPLGEKETLDLVHGGEPEAVAIEACRLAHADAREDAHVVCQRFDAPEAETLVADALADLLGSGR